MPFVETKPMPWAVNSLYSAKEGNKCTAAIVDTILVKGQDPKWLFTSKNGEVSKKRTCTGEAVRERFLKLLEATPQEDNPLRRCAVLRFPDSIKILSEEDFEKAIQNFPPRDSGLEALQVYMPSAGSAGTVYRNHYKVVSDKGRVQSATSSFASVPANLAHASSLTSEASQAVHAPSRAAKLNSTLDGATRTIVRYLESSHKVRVLDLEVDYVVDSDSQLWLLWCGDATVATGEAVLDLTLAGLTADRLVGRDSWLGEDVRKQAEAKERAESKTAAASGKSKQSSPVKGAGGPGGGGKRSRLPGAVPDDVAAQQVAAAAEVAEALDGRERLELVRRGNRERLDDEDRRAFGGKAYDDELEGSGAGGASGSKGQATKGKGADPHDRTFPNPFKSVGDFRRVGLRDPILLALDEGGELRSESLPGSATTGGGGGGRRGGGGRPRGSGGGDDDDEGPAEPPPVDILLGPDSGAARMSYQSVARARAEAQRLQEEQLLQEQDAAGDGSGSGAAAAAPGGGAKGGRRGPLKGIHAPTAASESRRKWAAQRGEVPGGAANFYKEVSVTPKDMHVYTLLDRARRLREKQERLAADDEGRRARSDFLEPYGAHEAINEMSAGGGVGNEHAEEWTRNSGDDYSSQGGHSQSGVGMSTERFSQTGSIAGSNSHNGSIANSSKGSNKKHQPQQQQPEPAKWRGRLVEPSIEGTAAHEEAVSGEVQKFDALDDYLRGKTDPREKGRRQQRAALARSQGAQEKLKDHARKEAGKLGPILAGAPDPDAGALAAQDELYFASVLICDEDANGADGLSAEGERARAILEKAGYYVDVESDGRKVIQLLLYQGKQYDCLLLERDCAVADGFEVTEAVRAKEKEERLTRAREHADAVRSAKLGPKHVNIDPFVALPIIAFTGQVSPDDLRAYMEVGMDGCVSKPVEQDALLATVRAAAPQHNKPLPEKVSHALSGQAGGGGRGKGHSVPRGPVANKMGLLGTLEPTGPGPHHLGSSALAAQSLSLPSSFAAADGSVSGVLQLDSETALPYTVVDFSMTPDGRRPSTPERHAKPFFNLVVCHDFFDTLERMKIVLSPLAVRYPGLQVLLWNYPGQAFTEWRPDQLLNNDYLASCLHELLQAVGPNGTKQFDVDKPFHLLGFGNGANVATFYAAHYNNPSIRALLSCNGFAFVDPHLAGALHDCMNVFSCAPPARPDLPVYFYSRFLFSPAYLAAVSTPLALNLYTAVHNPISLEGRIQLCLGALSHVDLRPHLAEIDLPILAVQATQGALVKPVHSEVFVEHRRGGTEAAEAKTIFEALKAPNKTVVVWVKSGHEMFQESRDQVVTLVEQMTTGYHETHDVAYQSAVATDAHAAQPLVRRGHAPAALGAATSGPGGGGGPGRPPGHGIFEDAFLDNVLSHAQSATAEAGGGGNEWSAYAANMQARAGPPGNVIPSASGGGGATTGGASTTGGNSSGGAQPTRRRRPNASKNNEDDGTGAGLSKAVLDASRPSFERQDNVVYKAAKGSRIYPNPEEFPEVKEYMGWRLKRNRKRLQRLDQAARIIQGAFRSYLAWTIVRRLREARAAAFIQRLYRGWKGRLGFLDHMRLIWAAQVVQRGWRGFAGRKFFSLLRRMHAAAAHIQRIGRGYNGRKLAAMKRAAQRRAAMLLQGLWRKRQARRDAFIMKKKVHGARTLQRVYRGHLGRRRAQHEREKYLFSKSQAQGIEFGRQMLLEHKLHATRLQSEVQLLTQEKVGAEERVEALLEEISEFEEAVAQLEKEMHDLSRIETEAVGVLDEDGRFELREQKTRLDREFGEMLSKIGDRRERLVGLENKLATLDRARQGKEEELRSLERKLVVLLDEQQRELESIKRRQEKKGEMLLKTQDAIAGNGNALALQGGESGGAGGGGHAGPSEKDKVQAAQLMQSTETLMKFGFMSMSMTYFSSLNMIRAMRNVAATDTVMAALQDNAQQATAAGGGGGGKHGGGNYGDKLGGEPYKPSLQPGQMPGDQVLKVSAWSVDDVARWLQTLALGQYREAFVDAAVDGAFLYDLNEDDLRNTLGIEHRLHRKKIINMISKLKLSEAERNQQLQFTMAAERAAELGLPPPSMGLGDQYLQSAMAQSAGGGGGAGAGGGGGNAQLALGGGEPVAAGPLLKFEEVAGLVRHAKLKNLKEMLGEFPSKRFDPALVKAPYVEDFGTAYVDAYEMEHFNMNKVDEFGNSLLTIAAQNGSVKIAKVLVDKGANLDHQNGSGETAAHYANAYGFMDFLSWVLAPAPDGGGANDTVENRDGLTPYDGLSG